MAKKTSNTTVFIVMSIGFVWTLILSALKLAHVVDWSWWIVAGPSLFMIALILAAVIYVNIVLKDVE